MSTNQPYGPPSPQQPAQYGQQPQYGQQYGQQQGPPVAAWPAQAPPADPQAGYAPTPPRPRRSGKGPTVVVTALITGVLSVAGTLLATGALTAPPTFDEDALTEGVAEVLTSDFDLTDADHVSCPAEIEATEGTEFECTFTSGGEDLSIPVTVLNDEGQYRVGSPAPS